MPLIDPSPKKTADGRQQLAEEKGEKSESSLGLLPGAMEKAKHAFKRPPLNIPTEPATLDAVSLLKWSRTV